MSKKKEFELLFKQIYKKLYSISFRITKNQAATEDIIQDIFLNAWEQNPTSIENYLVKSAYNRSLNYLRDNKKHLDFNDLARTNDLLNIEHDSNLVDYALLNDVIEQSIEQLPPRCRTIFVLCRFEGLKYKEISELLNISVKTVENQMGIAIKKLALELKPEIKKLFAEMIIFCLFAFNNLNFIPS